MALDPSIALGVRPVEIQNPLAQYGQIAQIQGAQNQNALAQYQLNAAQRADEQANVMNELYGKHFDVNTGKLNQNALNADLIARNQAGQIPVMQSKFAEAETKAAGATKAKAEAMSKQQELLDLAERDTSRDPSDANIKRNLGFIQASDLFTPQQKAAAEAKMMQMLTIPLAKRAEIMSQAGGSAADFTSRGQLKVSQGQLKVAQDRLAQDAQAVTYQQDANGNYVALPTKLPAGAVPTARSVIAPGGGMTPLQGKDSSKTAVSEQQAAYNIGRILNAAKQIDKVVKTDPSAIQPGAFEAGFNAAGMKGTANASRSADRQIVSGAQRDALDAMLYLATGAAYNKEQLEGQMEAYIPQYTDKPERVASKQLMMKDLIQSAKVRAGKAWTPEMEQTVQSLMNSSAPAAPASSSGVANNIVVTPDGQSHTFPTAAAAAQFKKAAGL